MARPLGPNLGRRPFQVYDIMNQKQPLSLGRCSQPPPPPTVLGRVGHSCGTGRHGIGKVVIRF